MKQRDHDIEGVCAFIGIAIASDYGFWWGGGAYFLAWLLATIAGQALSAVRGRS